MDIPFLRPTWAEIDMAAYGRNLQKVRSKVGPDVKILAVVKANAYGHGAQRLALYAQEHKLCDFLGPAAVGEGVVLGRGGDTVRLWVLGS